MNITHFMALLHFKFRHQYFIWFYYFQVQENVHVLGVEGLLTVQPTLKWATTYSLVAAGGDSLHVWN
jgi:hypothetical protein